MRLCQLCVGKAKMRLTVLNSLMFANILAVEAKSRCDSSTIISDGDTCYASILQLLPTQLYVGLDEVSIKLEQLQWYDTGEKPCFDSADQALNAAGVMVVQATDCKHLYIADGHHTVRTAWQYFEDPDYAIKVEVISSYCQQPLQDEMFWSEMINQSYAFPYELSPQGDLKQISAKALSEQVPDSILSMSDWWFRSLAYMVKSFGDFHPLKNQQGQSIVYGKFFEGQCLKDYGIKPQNITRALVGYAGTLFDSTEWVRRVCQLEVAPERRSINDIIERDLSCG